MLQQDAPDDYVIATGQTRSIREFLIQAFNVVGIIDWENFIKQDSKFMRPAEVDILRGDYTKANTKLGWSPSTSFDEMVRKMVLNDIEQLKKQVR
jgi:GDPmannose 4,6-dehydratase